MEPWPVMELPDFERLKYLAEKRPEELEQLRLAYCQQLIDNAPEHFRKKLAGLLFKINMETRRSKNSIHSCIKLSRMMMDSFNELQDALNFPKLPADGDMPADAIGRDNIIKFPARTPLQ
jgi:hypothetical protein